MAGYWLSSLFAFLWTETKSWLGIGFRVRRLEMYTPSRLCVLFRQNAIIEIFMYISCVDDVLLPNIPSQHYIYNV